MTCSLRTNSSGFPQRLYIALWFFVLSVLAGIAAYYWMFTGFSVWDDEGTLLLSVRQFLEGMKLYDQIQGYGPVYYFYNWLLRITFGIPATHDTVRMSSLVPWLLTPLVCAWTVLRLTRSLLLASTTHIFTFLALSFFPAEPGHPEDLCVLLMVCLIASGLWATDPRWSWLPMIWLGALTAALLLIKVNIGVFMILAVALAVLWHSPRTIFSQYLFVGVAVACAILPFVLMKAHLAEPVAERYCLTVTVSTISMLLVLLRSPRIMCLPSRDFWIAGASLTFVVLAVLFVLTVGQRISPHSILNSLVLVNLRISVNQGLYYFPMTLRRLWIPWIVTGLGVAAFFARNRIQPESVARRVSYLKLILSPFSAAGVGPFSAAGVLFQQLPLLFQQLPLIFQQSLPSIVPFSWLILYAPTQETRSSQAFPRTLLCSIAVLQILYAYPIAGSQVGFVQVPLIIIAMVCLGDFLLWRRSTQPALSSPVLRTVVTVLLLCVPASYLLIAGIHRKTYDSLTPLDLPGAGRIHVAAVQARDYQWLVQNLKTNCDVFFGMPELPSLHIWAGNPPPAGIVANGWMVVFTEQQQAAVSAELSKHPKACAYYNPQLVDFWKFLSHQNMDALPLARYLHTNFKVVGSLDDFSLLVRKDRDILELSSP